MMVGMGAVFFITKASSACDNVEYMSSYSLRYGCLLYLAMLRLVDCLELLFLFAALVFFVLLLIESD